MCRSGNHAIIFWLINNICTVDHNIQGAVYWNNEKKLYYYNNCNHLSYNFIENYNHLIKSFEDTDMDTNIRYGDINIIILRDYKNFIASRYKKYGSKLGLNNSYLQNYEQIRDLWIRLCDQIINNDKIIGIIYNSWLTSKEYRDNICSKLGIINTNDNTSIVSDIGEGSSFCGVKLEEDSTLYLNRFNEKLFENDIELLQKILDDYENNESIKKIKKILFD